MDITAETLQGFLDDAWDATPAAANTLRDQIRSFEKSITVLYSQGSVGSVSKNSTSQSYRGPGLGSYTPAQIANAWRMLINLFDEVKQCADWFQQNAVAWFVAKFPNYADDPDSAIYDLMKCKLVPINEYQVDVSELRLHPTLGNGVVPTW